jgi:hypothetical protein
MPDLRYFVGGVSVTGVATTGFRTLTPGRGVSIDTASAPAFEWAASRTALLYRIEFESAGGEVLLAAIVRAPLTRYAAPPLLRERAGTAPFRWRVVALGTGGNVLDRTGWSDASFPG